MSTCTHESYLYAVVHLLGHRQSAREESLITFLGRHDGLWKHLHACWDQMTERKGAPSPDQVFSWL
jgi:hypothetical protein